jgi:5-methylcytosine-specific restriction endonuclease McrA
MGVHAGVIRGGNLLTCVVCGEAKKIRARGRCRACYEYWRDYGKDRPLLRCAVCGEPVRADSKYQVCLRTTECRAELERRRRDANRDVIAERDRARYFANRDRNLESRRRYYQDNRESWAAYHQEYYEVNREAIKARVRKWKSENPERRRELHRAAKHRYRTALKSLPYLPLNEQAMFEVQQGLCAVCRGTLHTYHVDHIIPVSRGGWSVPANYQLLCVSCNLTKSSRFEWTSATLRVFNTMVTEMPSGWQVALINGEIVTTKANAANE